MASSPSPYVLNVDEAYYFTFNPDVAASGMSAAMHFSLFGKAEGRSPNALFDRDYYLAANPDVAAAGIDPFEHFLDFGLREGRSTTPLFDATFYLAQNPDVRAAVEAGTMTAVEHFFRFGQSEGRSPNAALDLTAYLAANDDVRAAVEAGTFDALTHLLTYGFAEGRDLGNGVRLTDFAADSAFTDAVAAQDAHAALARMAAVAPFFPDFQAPAGWQPATDTPIPTDFTPVDGAVLRVPAGVEIPEGMTLSRDVFLPYLTVTVEEEVLRFGGNAEGEITLQRVDGTLVFTREGESVSAAGPVAEIALGDASLAAPAGALDGLAVTGTGTVILSGLEAGTDLSGLAASLDVTALIAGDLDITGNAALGTVDTFRVAEGATLTLSAGQAGAAELEGRYVVQDATAAFFDGAAPRPFLAGAAGVTVTDLASLAQLAALRGAFEGELAYDSLSGDRAALLADMASQDGGGTFVKLGKAVLVTDAASLAELDAIDAANGNAGVSVTAVADTAANLMNDGTPFARVTEGVAVTVTDAATLAQLATIDAANGGGALSYTAVTDAASALATNSDGYVRAGTGVTVTGAATLAQLTGIDAANGNGALVYTAITDTAAALAANAAGYVKDGTDVTVTGAATLAQLAGIDADNGDGALVYTAITDTAAALATNAAGYVKDGTDVTVTDAATLAQLAGIDADNGDGALSYTAITDTAAALATNAAGYVKDGTDVTVTDAATLAQLAGIDAANGNGALSYGSVTDTAANLAANSGGYVRTGTDVTVTDAATLAQLAGIDAANGNGALSYGSVTDTAANLAANSDGYVRTGTDVTVADAATLAQLAGIDAANGNGALSYGSVTDTAANLAANSDGYVRAGTGVTVTDAATLAQLAGIDADNGNGALSYTAITDAAAALAANAAGYVKDGIDVTVTDAATIAQLVAIDGANGNGALEHALITDSWQALLADDAAAYLPGATTITLTSYNLGQVAVSDVQLLLAISNLVDGGGDRIELADLAYTLNDLPANLAQGNAAAIVIHADTVTASAPATVAQAVVIYDRDATASYAITDSAAALARSDSEADAAIRHAGDLNASTAATTAQATVIHDRDGAGAVHYDVYDHFQNLSGLASAVRNTAHDITVNGYYYGNVLSTADAATAAAWGNTGATNIYNIRGTASEVSAFVTAHQETGGETALRYTFSVLDSAAGVLDRINANDFAFVAGNAATELTDDNKASYVTVNGSFTVDQAQTFWNAVQPVLGSDQATEQRTYYGVIDSVVNYTNEEVATAGIRGTDYLRVVDNAANVHAAQNGFDNAHADIFWLLDSRNSGSDSISVTGSAGDQYIRGTAGSDYIAGGAGADYISAGAGKDTLHAGDSGADTVWNTAIYNSSNTIIGGRDGDNMFGSADFDNYIYQGYDRTQLIAESGTTQWTRDYISNFSLGDRIYFQGADSVQFLSNGLASASTVSSDSLGLAIRYEKNVQVLNYSGNGVVEATRVLLDVSDNAGRFDDVADMHIILVGSNIDVNWDNGALIFGG
ncbi:beta strand repeat-containing protein [Teichococcus aestuarii]|uniref:Calcium-binding protein n=1 Tax=Teichococcus aestuarii TaxID=568898 RepID=A0A2U1V7D8_9PROT|nr:hypothetical protein [Pseudoroseomonas aestuarii]PWC29812.1 hypothetical protein CR165_07775 [Pseudoroseomonas aestuarii]